MPALTTVSKNAADSTVCGPASLFHFNEVNSIKGSHRCTKQNALLNIIQCHFHILFKEMDKYYYTKIITHPFACIWIAAIYMIVCMVLKYKGVA